MRDFCFFFCRRRNAVVDDVGAGSVSKLLASPSSFSICSLSPLLPSALRRRYHHRSRRLAACVGSSRIPERCKFIAMFGTCAWAFKHISNIISWAFMWAFIGHSLAIKMGIHAFQPSKHYGFSRVAGFEIWGAVPFYNIKRGNARMSAGPHLCTS